MQDIRKQSKTVLATVPARDAAFGIVVALASSFLPFSLTFNIARANALTAGNYPGSAGMIAAFGLVSAVLAIIAVYDARNCPKQLASIIFAAFGIMAVLVSLTVF